MATINQFNEICARNPIAALEYADISREPQVLWAARKLIAGEWKLNGVRLPAQQYSLKGEKPLTVELKREVLSLPKAKPTPKKKGAGRAAADAKRAARRERDIAAYRRKSGGKSKKG